MSDNPRLTIAVENAIAIADRIHTRIDKEFLALKETLLQCSFIMPVGTQAVLDRLKQADIMEAALKQLQSCYPEFCARGDGGKWIAGALNQHYPKSPEEKGVGGTLSRFEQMENTIYNLRNEAADLREENEELRILCEEHGIRFPDDEEE